MSASAACYHLPGLFEFYDFYRVFLPLFRHCLLYTSPSPRDTR